MIGHIFSIYPSKVWSKWITFKKATAKFKTDYGHRKVERGPVSKRNRSEIPSERNVPIGSKADMTFRCG